MTSSASDAATGRRGVRGTTGGALLSAWLAVALTAGCLPAQTRSRPARTPLPEAGGRTAGAAAARGLRQITIRDEVMATASLAQPLKYRVALPAGYEASSRRYPTLYLLHGISGTFTDWESHTDLARHLRDYSLIVVMPDGANSWYVDAEQAPQARYEQAIGTELVADVEAKFRAIGARYARAVAGLSMGGYGALKFGLKSPARYAFAGSFSGALGAATIPGFMKALPRYEEEFDRIFGPPGSATLTANDLFALAERADPRETPFLYLDCGTEDRLLPQNREFAAVLQRRKLRFEYRERPGAHSWDYWNHQLPAMLQVLAERMPLVSDLAP